VVNISKCIGGNRWKLIRRLLLSIPSENHASISKAEGQARHVR